MGISDSETSKSNPIVDTNDHGVNYPIVPVESSDVVHIPVTIGEHSVIEGARQILDVLRPAWNPDDIHFKLFTDGITNKLVGCYHRPPPTPPRTSTAESNNPNLPADVVLIRIYGHKTDLLIDRQAETRNIQMLQLHGFAPSLYGVFRNGLAYEYVPGVTLTVESVVSPAVWPLVARRMAEMHRLDTRRNASAHVEPMLWTKVQRFLDLVPEKFSDGEKEKRIRQLGLPTATELRQGFAELYAHLKQMGSPVVFAHNDLLLGNVIYTESCSRVSFIDYEYADYNYQAFDIGNHFTEFAGIDEIDYSRYPSKDFQYKWLQTYLETYNGVDSVGEKEIHRLFAQVNAFALASHYFWAIWGLIQAEHSTIDFDFINFAQTRYNELLAKKERFLNIITE